MYDKSSICAIIVTFNIGKDLFKCFDSVKDQVNEVVIVDNGSNQETTVILNEMEKNEKVKVIYNGVNLGIAFALNQGVKYAINKGYDWVLTLDHDSKVTPGMIDKMLSAYNKLSNNEKNSTFIIVPRHVEERFYRNIDINDQLKPAFVITEITSGSLVKTDAYRQVGFYDEKLFIDYVDHEFCLRLKKYKKKILYVPTAILLHNLGTVQVGNFLNKKVTYTNHSYLRRYYITRNRIYVWTKYLTIAPRWVIKDIVGFLKEIIKIVLYENDKKRKFKMIFKGITDSVKGNFGKINMEG
ncbi:glycosyltransferase family 2 protein [Caldanaerobacter subterraneus]|nr:glycosyltransferase family 2 protein [Caldanaerobacter subterraneus]